MRPHGGAGKTAACYDRKCTCGLGGRARERRAAEQEIDEQLGDDVHPAEMLLAEHDGHEGAIEVYTIVRGVMHARVYTTTCNLCEGP
jgi:hypothetical protein